MPTGVLFCGNTIKIEEIYPKVLDGKAKKRYNIR
jgi:hypothetical protein